MPGLQRSGQDFICPVCGAVFATRRAILGHITAFAKSAICFPFRTRNRERLKFKVVWTERLWKRALDPVFARALEVNLSPPPPSSSPPRPDATLRSDTPSAPRLMTQSAPHAAGNALHQVSSRVQRVLSCIIELAIEAKFFQTHDVLLSFAIQLLGMQHKEPPMERDRTPQRRRPSIKLLHPEFEAAKRGGGLAHAASEVRRDLSKACRNAGDTTARGASKREVSARRYRSESNRDAAKAVSEILGAGNRKCAIPAEVAKNRFESAFASPPETPAQSSAVQPTYPPGELARSSRICSVKRKPRRPWHRFRTQRPDQTA
eukprot:gnl/Chilomastix_cuspidata/3470.p2 GENE.gnl/Chilomastix_cuspidata/3470~~gnl/Chilomastix_cuspidata/3470.p2  ORF type:complete len:318 (-),score=17.18 gnl/Chilomastix_cuspidata/3470:2595-3548(-)